MWHKFLLLSFSRCRQLITLACLQPEILGYKQAILYIALQQAFVEQVNRVYFIPFSEGTSFVKENGHVYIYGIFRSMYVQHHILK